MISKEHSLSATHPSELPSVDHVSILGVVGVLDRGCIFALLAALINVLSATILFIAHLLDMICGLGPNSSFHCIVLVLLGRLSFDLAAFNFAVIFDLARLGIAVIDLTSIDLVNRYCDANGSDAVSENLPNLRIGIFRSLTIERRHRIHPSKMPLLELFLLQLVKVLLKLVGLQVGDAESLANV